MSWILKFQVFLADSIHGKASLINSVAYLCGTKASRCFAFVHQEPIGTVWLRVAMTNGADVHWLTFSVLSLMEAWDKPKTQFCRETYQFPLHVIIITSSSHSNLVPAL